MSSLPPLLARFGSDWRRASGRAKSFGASKLPASPKGLRTTPDPYLDDGVAPERGHYHAIDFSRGLAALVVLIWHYQHFLLATPGSDRLVVTRSSQPLYEFLQPFYTHGYFAVQFFWMISGFVFAAVYLGRKVSSADFAVNRVARLYPLHLVTLLVVAILQVISFAATSHSQIYIHNDPWHFVLNLFFASHWGLEQGATFEEGLSFNGPVWSVSIEVVIYLVFWVTLPALRRLGIAGPAIMATICWMLHFHSFIRADEDSFRCGFYFFSGFTLFIAVTAFRKNGPWILLASLILVLAGLSVFMLRPHSTDSVGMPFFLTGLLLLFAGIDVMGHGRRFRGIRWIGDNTYGTYLWHVPVQIALLIGLDYYAIDRSVVLKPWFFVGFMGLTMLIARLSFLWIEAPAREWIRLSAKRD